MDYGSLISSLVGLGTKVGTSIAGLKKVKRSDAGSRAARDAGVSLAQKAVGASQAGHGASRALALRSGLRSAAGITREAAGAQAQAAQRDEAIYQTQKQERNERVANFGGDLAKGLADMAATQIGPKGESVTQDPNREPVEVSDSGFGEAAPEDMSKGLGDLEQDAVDQDRVEYEAEVAAAGEQLDDFRQKREEAGIGDPGGPAAAFQVDPATKLLESMPPRLAPEIEQHLADRLHMNELALAEAERLGISLDVAIPRMQRRLQLQPGQSSQNPMGHLKPDYDDTGVE